MNFYKSCASLRGIADATAKADAEKAFQSPDVNAGGSACFRDHGSAWRSGARYCQACGAKLKPIITCEYCGRNFFSPKAYRFHLWQHDNPEHCPNCKKNGMVAKETPRGIPARSRYKNCRRCLSCTATWEIVNGQRSNINLKGPAVEVIE